MRRLTLALLTSASCVLAMPATAQQLDQAGADALAAQIPAFLDGITQNAPDLSYSLEGEVLAEPDGDQYRLSLPVILFEVGRDAIGTIQSIEAQVTPLANGWQRAQWDTPSPIQLRNPRNDRETATIAFESFGNDLTFAPEYNVAMEGEAGFNTIMVTVDGEEGQIAIGGIDLSIATQEAGAQHSYDAQSALAMTGLDIDIPGEVSLDLESLTISGFTNRQRLDLFAEMQQAVAGLEPDSNAFIDAMVALLREHRDQKWMGGADYSFSLEALSFDSEDATASLDQAGLTLLAENLDRDAANLMITMNANGMSSPDVPPAFAPVVPSDVAFDILGNSVPVEAIAQEFYGYLGEPVAEEERFGLKGRRAGAAVGSFYPDDIDPMVFLGILLNSSAVLDLREFYVEAPIGYISADGLVEPNPAAAFQATASINLRVAGLSDMIAFAQEIGGDAGQAAAFASVIAAMGRDETDGNGTSIKAFDIEVTAAGQILLNGNDMSAMMGMFQ